MEKHLPEVLELPAHSKLGASGTHRWFNCHGSVALIESLKSGGMAEESSEYASAGTSAHDIAAICLQSDSQAADCVGFYDNYDEDVGAEIDDRRPDAHGVALEDDKRPRDRIAVDADLTVPLLRAAERAQVEGISIFLGERGHG